MDLDLIPFDTLPTELLEKILTSEEFSNESDCFTSRFSLLKKNCLVSPIWHSVIRDYISRKYKISHRSLMYRFDFMARFVDYTTITNFDKFKLWDMPNYVEKRLHIIDNKSWPFFAHHEKMMYRIANRVFVNSEDVNCVDCTSSNSLIHWHIKSAALSSDSSEDELGSPPQKRICMSPNTGRLSPEELYVKRLCSRAYHLIRNHIKEQEVKTVPLKPKFVESWSINKDYAPPSYMVPINVSLLDDGKRRLVHSFRGGYRDDVDITRGKVYMKISKDLYDLMHVELSVNRYTFTSSDFIDLIGCAEIPRSLVIDLQPPLVCIIEFFSFNKICSMPHDDSSEIEQLFNDLELDEMNNEWNFYQEIPYVENWNLVFNNEIIHLDDYVSQRSDDEDEDGFLYFHNKENYEKFNESLEMERIFTRFSFSAVTSPTIDGMVPSLASYQDDTDEHDKRKKILFSRRFCHPRNTNGRVCLVFKRYPKDTFFFAIDREVVLASSNDSKHFDALYKIVNGNKTYDSFLFSSIKLYFDLNL